MRQNSNSYKIDSATHQQYSNSKEEYWGKAEEDIDLLWHILGKQVKGSNDPNSVPVMVITWGLGLDIRQHAIFNEAVLGKM